MTTDVAPVSIKFLSYTRRTQDSTFSIIGDEKTLERIVGKADGPDLVVSRDQRYERHDVLPEYLVGESPGRFSEGRDGPERELGRKDYWVPPFGSQEIWDTLQVAAVSATGAAVFLRNVSGFLKDVLDMRRKSFEMTVTLQGTPIKIETAKQLQEIIDRLEKEASPPGGPSSPDG